MMKLAISNIAWTKENDEQMYRYLASKGVEGLEIAPTRIFPQDPYEHLKEAKQFAESIKYHYGLLIPSMQSIWFGRSENIFRSKEEREVLVEYTKRAIFFAQTISCGNLVFGSPKNRAFNQILTLEENQGIAEEFFGRIADFAKEQGTVIALEANHACYGTDFLNTTDEAIAFVTKMNLDGLKINLDTGNMLQNEDGLEKMVEYMPYINHVHFSEIGLERLQERVFYENLMEVLVKKDYSHFVSIEMKNQNEVEEVKKIVEYLLSVASLKEC